LANSPGVSVFSPPAIFENSENYWRSRGLNYQRTTRQTPPLSTLNPCAGRAAAGVWIDFQRTFWERELSSRGKKSFASRAKQKGQENVDPRKSKSLCSRYAPSSKPPRGKSHAMALNREEWAVIDFPRRRCTATVPPCLSHHVGGTLSPHRHLRTTTSFSHCSAHLKAVDRTRVFWPFNWGGESDPRETLGFTVSSRPECARTELTPCVRRPAPTKKQRADRRQP